MGHCVLATLLAFNHRKRLFGPTPDQFYKYFVAICIEHPLKNSFVKAAHSVLIPLNICCRHTPQTLTDLPEHNFWYGEVTPGGECYFDDI